MLHVKINDISTISINIKMNSPGRNSDNMLLVLWKWTEDMKLHQCCSTQRSEYPQGPNKIYIISAKSLGTLAALLRLFE